MATNEMIDFCARQSRVLIGEITRAAQDCELWLARATAHEDAGNHHLGEFCRDIAAQESRWAFSSAAQLATIRALA